MFDLLWLLVCAWLALVALIVVGWVLFSPSARAKRRDGRLARDKRAQMYPHW